MIPIYLDYETFYSTTHSLTRMPAMEYVMHPETEIISCAVKIGDGPTEVVFGEQEVGRYLRALPWARAMAIGHNMSGFDAMILAWRFGIAPMRWGCTAAMARSRYAKTAAVVGGKSLVGVSLKKLAAELTTGHKLDFDAVNAKGKHLADLSENEVRMMEAYNRQDTELCAQLFKILAKGFPRAEMEQIDMTTRMLVEPKFELDYALVRQALEEVKAEKRQSLLALSVTLGGELSDDIDSIECIDEDEIAESVRQQLASAAKFTELLKTLDVDVPMKASPTNPAKRVPALAKSDQAFLDLQEHDNPTVAAAARCRLEVKSTILETRLESFLRAADACGGKLPMPLKYAGADTTARWGGDQGLNVQNLPRIPRDKEGNIIAKPSNALRLALRAPEGHSVVVADLSGIELRVNMFLWKVGYAVALLQADPAKADLYKHFAAHDLYKIPESDVNKAQRQVGKVAQLGLGFGAGTNTFQKVARLMGGIDMDIEEAQRVVTAYRDAHPEIVKGWKTFHENLQHIKQGTSRTIDPWGLCVVEHERVRLPSGRSIHYSGLRRQMDNGKSEWWYGQGRTAARLHGPKMVENCVQALARDVIAEHALKFRQASGLSPALTVHDELVYVVPTPDAAAALGELQTIMRSGVSWWPELITWSEGDVAPSYGEAK